MVYPTIRFDPVIFAIGMAHPILVGVGATSADNLVDGGCEPLPVMRMNGCNYLRQAETFAAK